MQDRYWAAMPGEIIDSSYYESGKSNFSIFSSLGAALLVIIGELLDGLKVDVNGITLALEVIEDHKPVESGFTN